MEDFHQRGDGQKVLPTAVFLIGYVVGPLVFSPLSETIGRKPVLTWTFNVFVLATLACALAPNWPSLLVFRAICGTMGAAPQTVIGGVYADMFSDLRSRGRVMAFYMSVRQTNRRLVSSSFIVFSNVAHRLQASVQLLGR